jgi:uncharacterized tellurite resistance protein B-like protein
MLNRVKEFFKQIETETAAADHDADERQIAAAALLVEAAVLDGHFDDAEKKTVRALLTDRFELGDAETEDLLALAVEKQDESNQLFRFTHAVKEHFSDEERVEMIEMLWEVAYADGVLHDYEDNLLRRVAGLIYVTDRDRGDARKRVLRKLGLSG